MHPLCSGCKRGAAQTQELLDCCPEIVGGGVLRGRSSRDPLLNLSSQSTKKPTAQKPNFVVFRPSKFQKPKPPMTSCNLPGKTPKQGFPEPSRLHGQRKHSKPNVYHPITLKPSILTILPSIFNLRQPPCKVPEKALTCDPSEA